MAKNSNKPKQRKARNPKKDPRKVKPVIVEVNERQVAGDSLATSGELGSKIVERTSDFLQANGKIVLLIVLLLMGWFVFEMYTSETGDRKANEFGHAIEQAKSEKEIDDLIAAFDKLAEKEDFIDFDAASKGEKESAKFASDYYFEYATSLWQKVEGERDLDEKDREKYEKSISELVESYKGVSAEADPLHEARTTQLTNILDIEIKARHEFLKSPESIFASESEYKGGSEEPKLVDQSENPIIAFSTSAGDFRVELYEGADYNNQNEVVKLLVSLVERGYYERVKPFARKMPGLGNDNDLKFKGMSFIAFGDKGKLLPQPKEEDASKDEAKDKDAKKDDKKDEEADKEPEKETLEPYFVTPVVPIANSEDGGELTNSEGAVFSYYDPHEPLKRGAMFGINLGDNRAFDQRFQVVGRVLGDGMKVVQRLSMNDTIYQAWVEQKRKEVDYTPMVVFLSEKKSDGVPRLWLEKPLEWVPPRIEKPESPELVGDTENPVVWMSTEKGDVLIELFEDQVPNTVKNFIYIVENTDQYKDSDFHRVGPFSDSAKGLKMAQGGRKDGSEDFDWTIKNEAYENDDYRLRNIEGTIAMARETAVHTAGAQFFINLEPNPGWDQKKSPYCVFGRVIKYLTVIEKIRPDDKIHDVAVVKKRKNTVYDPDVKFSGNASYTKASEGKSQ